MSRTYGSSSWTIDNMLSYVFGTVLQVLKPLPGGRSQLHAAHKHVDPRPVGNRRLMMLTPNYLITKQLGKYPRADHARLLEE